MIGEAMSGDLSTNEMAGRLLTAHDTELADLVPTLIERVSREFGLPAPEPEHQWPADLIAAVREFLVCVATNDLERIGVRDGIFEGIGLESARVGMDFESLAAAIRLAVRVIQPRVHRTVLAETKGGNPDAVLELLDRVLAAGERVVVATRHGFDIAALTNDDEAQLGRRLGSELVGRGEHAAGLAESIGWHPESLVCAVVTSPTDSAEIARVIPVRLAHFVRADDVVLAVPLAADRLSTTLRSLLAGIDCVVGPAVPLADFEESLDLCQRLSAMPVLRGRGPASPTTSSSSWPARRTRPSLERCAASTSASSTGCPRTTGRCSYARSTSGCSSGGTGPGSRRRSPSTRRPSAAACTASGTSSRTTSRTTGCGPSSSSSSPPIPSRSRARHDGINSPQLVGLREHAGGHI